MKHYLVPIATFQATPPQAPHAAYYGPDIPGMALVQVRAWPQPEYEDAWLAQVGVTEFSPTDQAAPAPLAVQGLLGAKPGATQRDFHLSVRAKWPGWMRD